MESAVAVAGAVAGAGLKTMMEKLFQLLEKEYSKHKGLVQKVESINADLEMFYAVKDDRVRDLGRRERSAVETLYSEEMLDLEHDVEDCIGRFMHRLTCKQLGWWPVRRFTESFIRSSFADEIDKLESRLKEAHQRLVDNPVPAAAIYGQPAAAGSWKRDPCVTRRNLVGIVKPVEELLSLLDEVEGEPEQLRVISVVGFGGLGKTTLAKAVYDSNRVKEKFDCRAWVDAGSSPEINSGGVWAIIRDIYRQVLLPKEVMDVDGQDLEAALTDYLKDKRYLIVIDDITMEQWKTINSIFGNSDKCSRILLTTTIQSVANMCSHGNGYVYQVNSLGKKDSQKIALPGVPSPELEEGSATLLQKCDGLPLALVSVSDYLKSLSEPTGEQCAELCRSLGSHLIEKHGCDNFAELRKVILDNYENLPGYALACFLYLGIFPNNRPLRKKVVIRRWLAEGYARSDPSRSEEDIAHKNFDTLVDRNIIQAIDARNNGQMKTCRTYGIMHEFVLHKSMSQRFIAASSLDCREPCSANANKARHLYIHGGNARCEEVSDKKKSDNKISGNGLYRVRSVTLFGKAANAMPYVRKCKLLRVLDLEECSDLKEDHLDFISNLFYLRYLSLGASIAKLPRSIKKLHCLETLDLRRTKVNTLPRQAIELPHLAHLFGRLMLDNDDLNNANKIRKLHEFLSEESNLQTLAGFITNGGQGFLQFIGQMKKLRKVKIWCKPAENGANYLTDLSQAIQEFTRVPRVPMDGTDARSISVNSKECSEDLLSSLNFEPCPEGSKYDLRSLKLHGKLIQLPPFVTLLSGLRELCISSATLTRDLLSALTRLRSLLYLKLIADQLEIFEMRKGSFPSLRRLCFVVQNLTSAVPTIEQGALPNLISLQLLCRYLVGLSRIEIRHIENLKEVTIHTGVTDEARQAWERAVKNHPNRPRLKSVDPKEREEPGQEVSSERGKRSNCEPSTDDGLVSGVKKMRLSVSEPSSSRLQVMHSVPSSYSGQQ